jgi:hypothetical protein
MWFEKGKIYRENRRGLVAFHRSDSEGCTIVTIERHVGIDFRPVLYVCAYICALHAQRARPLRFFFPYRVDNRIHAYSTRTAPFRASAEVLANYRF